MMILVKRLGFSRFESMLGFGLLALILVFAVPPMRRGMIAERPVRAVMDAELVAHAVLDYHTDTGNWPLNETGQADWAQLVSEPSQAGTGVGSNGALLGTLAAADSSWLPNVPVDPWGRPYEVKILGARTATEQVKTGSGYPDEPPAGTSIVVFSLGANGRRDTSFPATAGDAKDALQFQGDDLGFVLIRSNFGGNQ